jgi:hypothetical protein
MLELNSPQKQWAIAHDATDLTGMLWNDQLFTFRSHAEQEIARIRKLCDEEGEPMRDGQLYPVLVKVTVALCTKEETAAYDAEQTAWLHEHGQAAKRRQPAQTAV